MPDRRRRLDQLVIEVDRYSQQHAATIRVHGEIGVATAAALQRELEAVLGEDVQWLVLDLTGVPFCHVSGLNLMLRVQSQLAPRGGHLTVCAPCRPLRVMVSVLDLEGRLSLTLPPATAPGRIMRRPRLAVQALPANHPIASRSARQPRHLA